ncbi:MAG: hypothetical protein IT440_15695 [Phycisphaeraceae bacterium]|nr:hypothetical protein [Phycisphaeraceae bacterium]
MEKPKLVKVTEWSGNDENKFAVMFGEGFGAQFAFISEDGSVGDSTGVATPAKWETAKMSDLPDNADLDEITYQIEGEL